MNGDGHRVPRSLDAWLFFTLAHPNVAPLAHSLGVLDASGQSVAALALPPGAPASLAGAGLHRAFVVLGAQGVQLASIAVPLTLDP